MNVSLRWISIETDEYCGESMVIKAGSAIALQTPDSGSNNGWAGTLISAGED